MICWYSHEQAGSFLEDPTHARTRRSRFDANPERPAIYVEVTRHKIRRLPSHQAEVCQRGSLDQLQHQRPRPLGFLDAVDGGNVRVVETGEDLRLPREPGEPVRVRREVVGEDLQGDLVPPGV